MAKYTFQYLPILPSEMPISKTFTIGTTSYIFRFYYNARNDFYSVVISDVTGKILYSSKIIYGQKLYDAVVTGLVIDYEIIPIDLEDVFSDVGIDNSKQAVNASTLGSSVKLYYNGSII